jgi:DUF4097 and DUF4098 domain-containing protein YvlB
VKHALLPLTAALALSVAAAPAAAQDSAKDAILRAVVHDAQSRQFPASQTDRQTRTLAIGANGDVTLKNIAGDITVKAGGTREATIEIVRVSRGRTDADAKLGLERVIVEVTTSGERADVHTRYPNDRNPGYSVSVSYSVTAPAGTGVNVETISGNVRVAGLQGATTVRSISGNVDVSACARLAAARSVSGAVTLTDVQNDGDLEVEGVSSDVRLSNVKARKVTAGIVSGTISARDVQADGAVMSSVSGNIEFSGSVAPRGRYEFKAFSGNVRIGVLGGFDLEASTFSGAVEADSSLGLPPSQNRRTLRGVVGNGGAAVVATTFSGNVWVGRKLG